MDYDWQKLSRSEEQRHRLPLLAMGVASIAVGIVGIVILLLTPSSNWIGSLFSIVLGAIWLAQGIHARKHKAEKNGDENRAEPPLDRP